MAASGPASSLAVNGATLACDEAGQGAPAFLFVHGLAGDRSFWRPQFEDLSRDFHCLALDLRGCGDSSLTPPYDLTQAADDVAAVIEERGMEAAVVVGHDLGGLVALLASSSHADRVIGMVMVDPPLDSAARGAMGGLAAQIREADSMEPARVFFDRFFGEESDAAMRDHIEATMLACDPQVAAGQLTDNGYFSQQLGALLQAADRKPFMALWGDNPLGDPERLRQITQFLRQEPVAEAGHFLHLEKPAITNALLRAFVDDIRRDPRISAFTTS